MNKLTLPVESTVRKSYAIAEFCDDYFPAALAQVALHSFEAGAKHTQGKPMHKRWLSTDHRSCIRRHMLDFADLDAALRRMAPGAPSQCRDQLQREIISELRANAWRSLALLQEACEKYMDAPLAPAAVLLEQVEAQPVACAGVNCGSTAPHLHSAECFAEHDRVTAQRPWRLVRRSPAKKAKAKRRKVR